jgi:predicted Ser/Thr protein kinase
MASFAHALKSFSSGSLSQDELYAEVERILADGRGDETWLLETLDEENTRVPLPEEVHAAVKSRIEQAAADKRQKSQAGGDTHDAAADPDISQTRLATQFSAPAAEAETVANVQPAAVSVAAGGLDSAAAPGLESVKGVGDVLNDRFVLEERLGAGGMSTVYKAIDRRKLEADDRNPYVAVKVLNVEFRAHPQSLIALQREAKKSQSLAHPNIVRVYDFDRDGSTVYMTMEYLQGRSLAQIFRARGFKGMLQEEALPLLEQIADALKFAHDNGIVHADFKPANVIITESGQVKVIDFGIARAFQRPDQADMEATRFDPGSLGALTPTYASPEMLEHREVDPRDDVYALGCIAYEMFTGRHPFGRMQATEARDGGLQLERRKGVTRKQWNALKSALAFDREQRTPTVRQFCDSLHCQGPLSSGSRVRIAGVAAGLLAAAGIGIYYYSDQSGPASGGAVREPATAAGGGESRAAAARSAPAATGSVKQSVAATQASSAAATPALPTTAKAAKQDLPKLSLAAVMPVLDGINCAALDASVSDGAVGVRGYVSRQFDVNNLEKALLALPGAKKVSADVTPVSDEKCAVLDVYEPYWRTNRRAGEDTSVRTRSADADLTEGDPLVVRITTPPYESYVSLDYYSLDGGVVHMVPGPRMQSNQAPAGYSATIGDLGEWIIAEPFGTELVAVLTTPERVFDEPRAEVEKGSDYLKALKQELAGLGGKDGHDRITADLLLINTRPKAMLERLKDTLGSN